MEEMRDIVKVIGIIVGFLVGIAAIPVYALGGSMGPARMTLRTEVPFLPFLSQDIGIIEVPIRVANTANEPEKVVFFATEDLNNSDIMTVEFAEEQIVLEPNEEREVKVTFKVRKAGIFSGNIVALFSSASEQKNSAIGSKVGFRLNSKVTVIAESRRPNILYIGGIAGGILVLIGMFLHVRRKRKKRKGGDEE